MRTSDGVKEFMTSRGTHRPGTRRIYGHHLALFQAAFPGRLPEKAQAIQEWLNGFAHLAPATVASRLATIRAMYHYLGRLHPHLKNPVPLVTPPRMRPRAMRTFTDEEKYALFTLPLCIRDRALLTLLLDTGARRGEVSTLTWANVDRQGLIVAGKAGERFVPISETNHRLLKEYRDALGARAPIGHDQRVFQGRKGALTAHGIYVLVRRLCRRAGINGRRAAPHTFRATFATSYAAEEACDPQALQRILGHQNFTTTLRYINASRRHVIENHRLCTPLRGLEALAQGRLIRDQEEAIQEAEQILTKRENP